MASPVAGFDDWMTDALVKEALAVGESVDKFVARAVAARIAVQQARRGDPERDEVFRRIRHMDLEIPRPEADVSAGSVIADPERLRVLYETGLLDSDRAAVLDRLVEMAVAALGVPSAAVSLVDRDRVYVPSAIGMPDEVALARQIPIDLSISGPIVATGEPVITSDARTHPAMRNHPMVRDGYLVAFAGFPITDRTGHTVGALAMWDSGPREWSPGHLQVLENSTEVVREKIFGESTKGGKPVERSG